MNALALKRLIPFALILSVFVLATPASSASSGTCSNSCVTMAIPRSDDGVYTKLDGTADAVLWPPSQDLRTIRISALNSHDRGCDVTIDDVRQDEAPGVAGSGATIDDAVNCSNDGQESSVDLRSDRSEGGDGRAYHIRFTLADPDCVTTGKADEVLVLVPHDENTTSLKSDIDDGPLTASYSGTTLQCAPPQRDARVATSGTSR
jgi:hypothetical protein